MQQLTKDHVSWHFLGAFPQFKDSKFVCEKAKKFTDAVEIIGLKLQYKQVLHLILIFYVQYSLNSLCKPWNKNLGFW